MEIESKDVLPIMDIVDSLLKDSDVEFKSQQRGEAELSDDDKREAAMQLFTKSKFGFLNRFGRYLNLEQLEMFKSFCDNESEAGKELILLLESFMHKRGKLNKLVKNRRFEALRRLTEAGEYFSDTEMMKRNPLLYHQLIGQYLSEEEIRLRDRPNITTDSFVKILLEGIERDQAQEFKKEQEDTENDVMEEEEDSSDDDDKDEDPNIKEANKAAIATSSKWGECSELSDERINKNEFYAKTTTNFITADERNLLREEFVTFMHQSFLDGKDSEFDYKTVDENEDYDDAETINHDAEDSYFDSEEPADAEDAEMQVAESSEDELDIYMNALNQHPSVCALSKDLKRL